MPTTPIDRLCGAEEVADVEEEGANLNVHLDSREEGFETEDAIDYSLPPMNSCSGEDFITSNQEVTSNPSTTSSTHSDPRTPGRNPSPPIGRICGEEEPDVEEETANLNENPEEEEVFETKEAINPSIYSLLFLSKANSKAHIYSTIICCGQLLTVIAALLDSFDRDAPFNPANIPPGVPIEVSAAQALMLPFLVAHQNDFIEAIVRLNDHAYEGIKMECDLWSVDTTFVKWLTATLGQLMVGIGIVILAFVFTMQSETVFDVFVNFVALFAVSNISMVAFNMARRGFLGYDVWKDASRVVQHTVKRKYKAPNVRTIRALYALCMIVMYLAYGVVLHRQLTGYYLCSAVFVQFDDRFQMNLPYLSGVYTKTNVHIYDRFKYVDELTKSRFLMGYCGSASSWGVAPFEDNDPCSYSVLSQPTESFDVTTTGHIPWRVHNQRDDSLVDTRPLLMQCADCDTSSCNPDRGTCMNNQCVCKNGRYGLNCEFRAACETVVLNSRLGDFPPILSVVNGDYEILDSSYDLLTGYNGTLIQAYHRPVYVSARYKYLLMFSGRRWVIINPWALLENEVDSALLEKENAELMLDAELRESLVAYFNNVHLYDALTNPLIQQFAVSEDVAIGSPVDNGSPIGLHWMGMRAVRSASRPVQAIDQTETFDAMFICAFCTDGVNDCENFGTCNNATKKCECTNSTLGFPLHTGPLCEKSMTCTELKEDFGDDLPTGCAGDYKCRADGTCDCLEQFPDAGSFCQFLPCFEPSRQEIFPGGCDNNGTCSNTTGFCTCERNYFEGRYCQTQMANCYEPSAQRLYPGGCANGGVCNNDGFCSCNSDTFTGRYCHQRRPPCDSAFIQGLYPGGCANGGTCNTKTGACDCQDDIFQGRYCESTTIDCHNSSVDLVFPGGCANGGTCNGTTGYCLCEDSSFHGRYCQELNSTSVLASVEYDGYDY